MAIFRLALAPTPHEHLSESTRSRWAGVYMYWVRGGRNGFLFVSRFILFRSHDPVVFAYQVCFPYSIAVGV